MLSTAYAHLVEPNPVNLKMEQVCSRNFATRPAAADCSLATVMGLMALLSRSRTVGECGAGAAVYLAAQPEREREVVKWAQTS